MAWDNEGTRAGDYGQCGPCGNWHHADDPNWADDTPADRDPICQNCRDDERKDDTNEDHQHDTGLELEMFGPAIP
jgi:hypothetical protein